MRAPNCLFLDRCCHGDEKGNADAAVQRAGNGQTWANANRRGARRACETTQCARRRSAAAAIRHRTAVGMPAVTLLTQRRWPVDCCHTGVRTGRRSEDRNDSDSRARQDCAIDIRRTSVTEVSCTSPEQLPAERSLPMRPVCLSRAGMPGRHGVVAAHHNTERVTQGGSGMPLASTLDRPGWLLLMVARGWR